MLLHCVDIGLLLECWVLSGFRFWSCQIFSNRILPGVDSMYYLLSRTLPPLRCKNDASFVSWPLMFFFCYWFSCIVAWPWLACFHFLKTAVSKVRIIAVNARRCLQQRLLLQVGAYLQTQRPLVLETADVQHNDQCWQGSTSFFFLHSVLQIRMWNTVILNCDTFTKYVTIWA